MVREVAAEVREDSKFSTKAFEALRTISEDYITSVMRIANEIAAKDARVVVSKNDFQLAVVEEKRRKQRRRREYKKACIRARRLYKEELATQPPPEAWEWETSPKVVDLADQLGAVNFTAST
jgi:histone H3/H4